MRSGEDSLTVIFGPRVPLPAVHLVLGLAPSSGARSVVVTCLLAMRARHTSAHCELMGAEGVHFMLRVRSYEVSVRVSLALWDSC